MKIIKNFLGYPPHSKSPITTENGLSKSPIPKYFTTEETSKPKPLQCGTDYIGSLYQKMVKYASQVCIRPSKANEPLSDTVLQDINVVMDEIRTAMSNELSKECERLGGIWVDTPYESTDTLFETFYTETSANTVWGHCAKP